MSEGGDCRVDGMVWYGMEWKRKARVNIFTKYFLQFVNNIYTRPIIRDTLDRYCSVINDGVPYANNLKKKINNTP